MERDFNKPFRYGRELPGYPFNAKAFLTRCLIVLQRKIYRNGWFPWSDFKRPKPDWNAEDTQKRLAEIIRAGKPVMVARFGSGELEATLRGLAILDRKEHGFLRSFFRLLAGKTAPFWWDNSIRAGLCWVAGYFPPTDDDLDRFAARVFQDCAELDILATWQEGEGRMRRRFFPDARLCSMDGFTYPFQYGSPWYSALAGRRVLVVHPFGKTIRFQFACREGVFPAGKNLPDFDLLSYLPPMTFGGHQGTSRFATWIETLDSMIEEIRHIPFDIALIGAGAYGMCLAAAVKRMGRIGIHMGGATQLLFGIKGGRWDGNGIGDAFYNEHWVRPSGDEVPENSANIEGGGYW